MKMNEFIAKRDNARKIYAVDESAGRAAMVELQNECGGLYWRFDDMADSIALGNNYPNMNDCPFPRDAAEIDSAFRAMGITRFTISAKSTGLLGFMAAMYECGWDLIGLAEVKVNKWDDKLVPAMVIDLAE